MADKKVTVKFETTEVADSDGNEYSDILLSGPVDIFATVDELGESSDDSAYIAHPTLKEYASWKETYTGQSNEFEKLAAFLEQYSGKIALFSEVFNKFMMLAPKFEPNRTLIVFVNCIRKENSSADNQDHRGAYFKLVGVDETNGLCRWQEILLGTHSHDNIEALESLSNLSNPDGKDGLLVVYNSDGTFSTKELSASQSIPELPKFIQDGKAEIEAADATDYITVNGTKISAPANSTENVLDNDLSDDSKESANSCRDLYVALAKQGKDIYLKKNSNASSALSNKWLPEITLDKTEAYNDGNSYLYISSANISFDGSTEDNHAIYSSTLGAWIVKFLFDRELDLGKDNIFVFANDHIIQQKANGKTNYKVVEYDSKTHILKLNILNDALSSAKMDNTKLIEISILAVKDSKSDFDFRYGFEYQFAKANPDISLDEIRETLLEEYAKCKIFTKPKLPQLFLSTDENGNIVWTNKFAPAQRFFSAQIVLHKEDLTVDGDITVDFPNAYFSPFEDFPILIINDGFAFNEKVEALSDNSVRCTISKDNRYLDDSTDNIITLIIIKSGSGSSLADELADKYISREEAARILSKGKLDLKDYLTADDADRRYAGRYHSHSQYSIKGHNHDERYADYHHTHPELLLALAQILSSDIKDETTRKEFIDKIDASIQAMVGPQRNLLDSLNKKFDAIDDGSINSSKEFVDAVNNLVYQYNDRHDDKKTLITYKEGETKLSEALCKLIEIFDLETITTEQVVLKDSLAVKLLNGPIGGLDTEKTYVAGTALDSILRDILDPYYDTSYVLKVMKPSKATSFVKWYIKDDEDGYIEVDIDNIRKDRFQPGVQYSLYFSVELRDEAGKPCEFSYLDSSSGTYRLLKLAYHVRTFDSTDENIEYLSCESDKYYLYPKAVDLYDFAADPIVVDYDPLQIVDNRGQVDAAGTTLDRGTIRFSNEKSSIDLPDFYYGVMERTDEVATKKAIMDELYAIDSNISIGSFYAGYFDNGNSETLSLTTSNAYPRICIILEDRNGILDNQIIDEATHTDILPYFEQFIPDDEYYTKYTVYYFDVFYDEISNKTTHKLTIREG